MLNSAMYLLLVGAITMVLGVAMSFLSDDTQEAFLGGVVLGLGGGICIITLLFVVSGG